MEFGVFDHVDRSKMALADYFDARLRLVEAYDRYGFYGYHVAEHHATPLGLASSPGLYLAAVAQRTRQLRFGPLVYLLPFYHPLRLVEEICMLDQMSRGRLQIGVGRGISPFEARYYGLVPEQTRAQYDEILDIMLKGMTQKTLTHEGPAYRFTDVPMAIEPFQTPYPPLWMGVQSVGSAETAAQRGANIVSLLPPKAMKPIADAYRAAASADAAARKVGLGQFIVVAESDLAARDAAEEGFTTWRMSFNYLYRLHGTGPMLGEQPETFADMIKTGRGIAGTPATVTAWLQEAIAVSSIDYLVGQFVFGDLDMAIAQRSIDLFAREVMPALANKK